MKEITYNNEGDVKKQVKKLLDAHKVAWWMPAQGGYGKIGVSDFNALRAGVFFAVETKFGKGKLTAPQKEYLRMVLHQGGYAFVVNEETLRALDIFMTAFWRSADRQLANQEPTPEDGAAMLDMLNIMTEAYK